jgi:methionyl-tRNA formyltransferase
MIRRSDRLLMAVSIRLIMLGTGDFALPTFQALVDSEHHVVALVTQPDRPQGRKQELIPSRIKLAAVAHATPIQQPENVNAAESLAEIGALEPDLLVTAAYGQILSADLLALPRLGGINLHGSILPAYRGAAPVARAIQNGETESGVTVIQMTPRIDAGGVIAVARTSIDADEAAGELEERLARLGAPLVVQAVNALAAGPVPILPQEPARVSRAPKLRKDDGLIDWSRPARAIHDLVRAMQPWPAAFTTFRPSGTPPGNPIRLIVHRTSLADVQGTAGEVLDAAGDRLVIAAGEAALRILVLQIPGKKPMSAAEFLRGHRIEPGERLGSMPRASRG